MVLPQLVYQIFETMTGYKHNDQLIGKVVLITGASSGVGEALAHCFYSKGCKVILAARRSEELNRVKQDLLRLQLASKTYSPLILPLDISELDKLESHVKKIYDVYNNIDILVNNAGVSNRGNILSMKIDVDIQVMSVNYFGPIALTKAILPKMVKQRSGHIVFVSSIQGRIAIPERSAYAASKHAIQAFADTLRAEMSQHNIDVSVISPGYIKTALSVNAITGSGDKYGAMDASTASGYSAEYVANEILKMVVNKKKELLLCPFVHKFAVLLRYLLPSVYFWIMARRAKKSI